jgi:transcriptional regulator with XRE-family HTH domain
LTFGLYLKFGICNLKFLKMSFEKRKIQSEILGEYLAEVRKSLGLSLEDAAVRSGIKSRFLEGLERGDFSVLPPDVYTLGFLRQLAEIYSVDGASLAEQFKKERLIANQLKLKQRQRRPPLKNFFGRIVVTPKLLSISLGAAFVAATVIYIIWQVASINKSPSLEIFEPQNNQLVKSSFLTVKGRTDPGMSVSVNGNKDVFVDNDGNFEIQLALAPGPKNLEIVAQNRFGKSTEKILAVIGQEQAAASLGRVELRLDFLGDVDVAVSADDGPMQNFSFHRGDSKVFLGQKKVVVSVSDAGLTAASLNGHALGKLGRPGQKLFNIPFFPDSGGGGQ